MKKFLEFVGGVVIAGFIGSLLSVMFIEWMAGCGETYIDSKGVHHANECIIINHGGNK